MFVIDPIDYKREKSGNLAIREDGKLTYNVNFKIKLSENHGMPETPISEININGVELGKNEFGIRDGKSYGDMDKLKEFVKSVKWGEFSFIKNELESYI